jgi:hypothetical protein
VVAASQSSGPDVAPKAAGAAEAASSAMNQLLGMKGASAETVRKDIRWTTWCFLSIVFSDMAGSFRNE